MEATKPCSKEGKHERCLRSGQLHSCISSEPAIVAQLLGGFAAVEKNDYEATEKSYPIAGIWVW